MTGKNEASGALHGRRTVVLGAITFSVTACTSNRNNALADAGSAVFAAVRGYSVSEAESAAIPYASLGVRVGDGPESIAVLARARRGELHWVFGTAGLFVTRASRITGWYDGDCVMADRTASDTDPLSASVPVAMAASTAVRQLDLPRSGRFGVIVRSAITVLAGIIEENSVTDGRAWQFRNRFQLDGDARLVSASTQAVAPDLPPVSLRVLRPYAG